MKIIINACHGGFGLSDNAIKMFLERGGKHPPSEWWGWDSLNKRIDPILIATVEELGEAANGEFSKLKIVDIPAGTKYRIREYDGLEWIETEEDINWQITA